MGGSESRDIGRDAAEEGGETSNQGNTTFTGVGADLGTALLALGAAACLLVWGASRAVTSLLGVLAWVASRALTDSSDHQELEDNNNIAISHGSHGNSGNGSADGIQLQWIKPAHGRFKLNSDASFNEGLISGIGGLIRNSQGELILAYEEPCFTADDIVGAEFLAVLKGLQYAVDQKIQDIDIETDNSSVHRILATKESPQKYQKLLNSANDLLRSFKSFKIADLIPRELNSCADLMAKNAKRDQKVVYRPPRIPDGLRTRLRNDLDKVYTRKI